MSVVTIYENANFQGARVWDIQDFPNLSQDLSDYNPGNSYWDIAALDIL
jgi:hypothetical protein